MVGPTGGNVGVGFAIPQNMVREVAQQLVKFGDVHPGRPGMSIQDLTADLPRGDGAYNKSAGAVVAKVGGRAG
jgi:S1-C subfamily serine protease